MLSQYPTPVAQPGFLTASSFSLTLKLLGTTHVGYTPFPEKGTDSILAVTLTNLGNFSRFLA